MSEKPKEKVYKLQEPVEFGKRTVAEITLKRPKGKHLKDLGKDAKLGDIMSIAPKISGEPQEIFDEMDGADYLAVSEVIGDFLDNGQETGKTI